MHRVNRREPHAANVPKRAATGSRDLPWRRPAREQPETHRSRGRPHDRERRQLGRNATASEVDDDERATESTMPPTATAPETRVSRARPSRPRCPRVQRRWAQELPMAVATSATTTANAGPRRARSTRNRASDTAVLAMPMIENTTNGDPCRRRMAAGGPRQDQARHDQPRTAAPRGRRL